MMALATIAEARNNTYMLNIANVMSDPGFNQPGSRVILYFANQTPPKVAQNLGDFVGNKIAKTWGQPDEQRCQQAALGALSQLRDEATKRGGNAVINIESF